MFEVNDKFKDTFDVLFRPTSIEFYLDLREKLII